MSENKEASIAAAFNAGLNAAISVIRGGIHAATANAGLWGIQDDEQIYIAAIERLKR